MLQNIATLQRAGAYLGALSIPADNPEAGAYLDAVEPDRPNASRNMVRTPAGNDFDVMDPALATELGDGVRVIKQDRGVFDSMPLSIITTRTVAGLSALTGSELDVLAALPAQPLIVAAGEETFPEDAWAACCASAACGCASISATSDASWSTSTVTTRRNPAVLRVIARECQVCLGAYDSTVQPGRIAVGDPVIIGSRYEAAKPTPA